VLPYFGAPLGAAAGAGPAGVAGGDAGAGCVTGVITTPITSPLTASFCFLLVVPRALRVAFSFAVATTRFSVASGWRTLRVCTPKSPKSCSPG
jgi:hypothetical protein